MACGALTGSLLACCAQVERLSWIHKVFFEDVDAVTVQEHMEMDNLYAEYDLVSFVALLI